MGLDLECDNSTRLFQMRHTSLKLFGFLDDDPREQVQQSHRPVRSRYHNRLIASLDVPRSRGCDFVELLDRRHRWPTSFLRDGTLGLKLKPDLPAYCRLRDYTTNVKTINVAERLYYT